MSVLVDSVEPGGLRRETGSLPRGHLPKASGVQIVVVAIEAGFAIGVDIEIVAGLDPKDVVPQKDVGRSTLDQQRVADRLVDRIVDDLGAVAGGVQLDSFVRVGVNHVIGDLA